MEAALIPLDQLIPEFLLALGGAFLLGNLAAYIRLRSAWREAKQAGQSRVEEEGRPPGAKAPGAKAPGAKAPGAKAVGAKAPGAKAVGAKGAGARATTLPSRTRVLANVVVGLVVTAASLAALIARG
jgi:hypothetical protein